MTATVELHLAFTWDCDECGRENFCRALQRNLTGDEIEEIALSTGITEDDCRRFVFAPEVVQCVHCSATFDTEEE